MKKLIFTSAVVLSSLVAPLSLTTQPVNATTSASSLKPLLYTKPRVYAQLFARRACRRVLGPFATQRRAYEVSRYYQRRGFRTGVWGQGGIYYGTRKYYVAVFYRC